jgi:hypothetical protein
MSLFSSVILPHLEKELINIEPQVAEFLLNQLKKAAAEIVEWAELKLNADLNGDGKVGAP